MRLLCLVSGLLVGAASLAACTGDTGPQGPAGMNGENGMNGSNGSNGSNGTPAPVDVVQLPGDTFFPESVFATADGTLYVSSAITGEIAKISPDGQTVTTFVAAETTQPIGKTGVFVDEAHGHVWACAIATDFSVPTEVREYDLATGSKLNTYQLTATGGVCNDMVMDATGNLYITDSFVGIERLPANGTAIDATEWASDPLFQPATQGNFAVDGIVIDGSDLFVNNLDKGIIVRVPINGDGSAGTAVEIKTSEGASLGLVAPDGMRLLTSGTIVTSESSIDTVSKIVIDKTANTATREVLSNRLDRPSAVAVAGGALWVTEGQIFRAFGLDDTPVNIPFQVVRVALF